MVEQGSVSDIEDDDRLTRKAKSLVNRLLDMARDYAHDRNRVRGLVLFEERDYGTRPPRPISKVACDDRPEIELILQHRTECMRIASGIFVAQEFITILQAQVTHDKSTIFALENCLKKIAVLETQRMAHFNAMETLLTALGKTMTAQEMIMARLAGEASSLTQKMTEHKDKMDLANKAAAIPTTMELKQRLAIKYGVPIEQVDAILGAKSVEADPVSE